MHIVPKGATIMLGKQGGVFNEQWLKYLSGEPRFANPGRSSTASLSLSLASIGTTGVDGPQSTATVYRRAVTSVRARSMVVVLGASVLFFFIFFHLESNHILPFIFPFSLSFFLLAIQILD